MSLTEGNGGNDMVMPVAPMYGAGGSGFGGWGGDNGWWIILLFLFAALALFLLGCKEGIVLLRKKGRICKAAGHIVDISTTAAETMKVYNSKWALVMYSVDGKTITSQNRIVVPMASNIGDSVEIQYDRDNPNVLISQSPKRFILFMLCAVMALIIAMFLKTR